MSHSPTTGKSVVAISALLLIGLFAQQALTDDGEEKSGRDRPHREPDASEVFERIDEDGDGVLSEEEFTEAFEKMRGRIHGSASRSAIQRRPRMRTLPKV